MECFKYNLKNKSNCQRKNCMYWMNAKNSNNCCINYKSDNKITLEEIGNIFDVTRMRICQIEKNAIKKIKKYFFAT